MGDSSSRSIIINFSDTLNPGGQVYV